MRYRPAANSSSFVAIGGRKERLVWDAEGIAHATSPIVLDQLCNALAGKPGFSVSDDDRAYIQACANEEKAKRGLDVPVVPVTPVPGPSQDDKDAAAAAEVAATMATMEHQAEETARATEASAEAAAVIADLESEASRAVLEDLAEGTLPEPNERPAGGADEVEQSDEDLEECCGALDDLYVKELRKVAEVNQIDISGDSNKGDIVKTMSRHMTLSFAQKTVERVKADR